MRTNYPYAKYTETFFEFLDNEDNKIWFDSLKFYDDELSNEEMRKVFIHTWRTYEIGGETEDLFKLFVEDVLGMHGAYFKSIKAAYDKDNKDWRELIVNTSSNTSSGENSSSSSDDVVNYELPHFTDGKDSSKPTFKSNDLSANTGKSSMLANSQNTNNTLYLEIKHKYLSQIRNINTEYAMIFKDCFIKIYN